MQFHQVTKSFQIQFPILLQAVCSEFSMVWSKRLDLKLLIQYYDNRNMTLCHLFLRSEFKPNSNFQIGVLVRGEALLYHQNSSRISIKFPIRIPIRILMEFRKGIYRDSGQNLSEYWSEFFKNPNKNSSWLLIEIILSKFLSKSIRIQIRKTDDSP